MYDRAVDGRLQVIAAASLLDFSRLVRWDPEADEFAPVSRDMFESSWRSDIDPVFGRLICWICFSTGAEFLAKGVCLLHGLEIRSSQPVPLHPGGDTELHIWAKQFLQNSAAAGTVPSTNFGTLKNVSSALTRLCRKVGATEEQRDMLCAAYKLLATTIRNRDAHAYVPNVRDQDFSVVPTLFAECFNSLVSWLPSGRRTLNIWRREASEFVASL